MTLLQDAGWRRDMESEWKEVISRNRPDLCKMIDTEGEFIDHLEGFKVFNNRTCQSFKSKTGRYSQVSAVLTALSKRPFEDFVKFCQALEKSNQGHIIRDCLSLNPQATGTLTTDPVVVATESTQADARPEGSDEVRSNHPLRNIWRDLIRDNYPALVAGINPDDGLFTHLVGKKVILDWMQDTFTTKTGRSNRVSAVLDHLIQKRPFEDFLKFCDALNETNQRHIVKKYFIRDQPSANQSDNSMVEVRPYVCDSTQDRSELLAKYPTLSNLDWKATFAETRSKLVDMIDASNDFINLLRSLGIFNDISLEACQEREDIFQRSEFILDYMRRRPDEDFLRFCVALVKSNQDHVITCLLNHRIERPPCESRSCPPQPVTRGGGDGGNETRVKTVCQPVDDNKPMEEMEMEVNQQQHLDRGGLDVQPRLCEHQGFYVAHHQQEVCNNAMPQAPQSIDLHPQRQQVICQPQDDDQGENLQSMDTQNPIAMQHPVANEAPYHEAAICGDLNELRNCQIIEEDSVYVGFGIIVQVKRLSDVIASFISRDITVFTKDDARGPVEIDNVYVTHCRRDFYERVCRHAYPMYRPHRGKCIIINNRIVHGMNMRNGTEQDGRLLHALFQQLHFRVEELNDASAEEIKQKMRSFSNDATLRNAQCLILFILSHGQAIETPAGMVDCVYGCDGQPVTVNEILEPLTDVNCPHLRNKPKLVFFQACRGDHFQEQTQTDAPPVFRDLLVGYPTQKNYRSFRNTVLGSWYINAVVQVFMQRACDTSLSDMLSLVTGKVDAWSTEANNHQTGQTATYTSHLTKSLYFFPGIVAEDDNR